MDDRPQIICCVQIGNVEVEVQRTMHRESDDGERTGEEYAFAIGTPWHRCRERLDMEELPDLIRAIERALRIVREQWNPHAAARIDPDKLSGVLQ